MPNASSDPRKRRVVTYPNGRVDFYNVHGFLSEYAVGELKNFVNSESGVAREILLFMAVEVFLMVDSYLMSNRKIVIVAFRICILYILNSTVFKSNSTMRNLLIFH